MFKNAALGIAVAGLLAASALAASATGAEAGKKFYFSIQPPGHQIDKNGQANQCLQWKRKWRRTGRQHFLRKYRDCLLHET